MLFHGRDHQEGEKGTEVDGPVKGVERLGHQPRGLVRNLVPHEGGNARLDAAGPQGDDQEARHQDVAARLNGLEQVCGGQHPVPHAVKQGNVQDGLVPSPYLVRQPRPRHRQQVHHAHEDVQRGSGPVLAHQQVAGHVQHQDGFHAVEAEAFAGFRADDEPGLGGKGVHGVEDGCQKVPERAIKMMAPGRGPS